MKSYRTSRNGFLAVIFLLTIHSAGASADLALNLQPVGVTTVASGQDVVVDLVIIDTDGSHPLALEGLGDGGGRIMKTGGAANAVFSSASDFLLHWDFFITDPASAGGVNEVAKALGSAFLTGAGVGNNSITIARFVLTLTGAPGSSIELTADVLDPLFGIEAIATFDSGTILDSEILSFGSTTFNISGAAAVPEPASVLLGAFTAAIAGASGYMKRRKSKFQQAT